MKLRLWMAVAGLLAGAALGVGGLLLAAHLPSPRPGTRAERLRAEKLPEPLERLKPLHRAKLPPGPSDWLAQHDEPGQSLKEYLRGDPVKVTRALNALYLVRIGDFTSAQTALLDKTREYLGLHFGIPVRELAPVAAEAVAPEAQRHHPLSGQLQWNSRWILDELLPPLRPEDGVAVMALTAVDLFPDPDWNFVFGQASVIDRVGVWSIARHGDLATEPKLVLLRTLKVAGHEAGHMFTLHHCIAFECLMNGSNNLPESDQGPLEPCPVCLAKLQEATGADLSRRFEGLREFLVREGLSAEADFVARSAALAR